MCRSRPVTLSRTGNKRDKNWEGLNVSPSNVQRKRYGTQYEDQYHILTEDLRHLSDEDIHRTLSEALSEDAEEGVNVFSLSEEDARPVTGLINGFLLGIAFFPLRARHHVGYPDGGLTAATTSTSQNKRPESKRRLHETYLSRQDPEARPHFSAVSVRSRASKIGGSRQQSAVRCFGASLGSEPAMLCNAVRRSVR